MQKIKSIKITSWLIAIIVMASAYFLVTEKWAGDNWKGNIQSDGKGYYAYLPAVFIYHDLQYGFQEKISRTYFNTDEGANYCNEFNGKKVNKYFIGTAILQLPFFLLALLFSYLFGYPIDGYNYLFQCAVSIAGLFYLVIGLIYLRKLLQYYFTEKIIAAVLLLIVAGTNLLYYSWCEASMSHVYSFAAINAFLFFSKNYLEHARKKHFFIATILFALVVIIRPSNAIIIFALPFLAGSFNALKNSWQQLNLKQLLTATIIFLLIVFLQPLIYFLQAGSFVVYSYGEEGFNFLHPEILNTLFSYRKGLFVYTPLTLIALMGFIFLWRKNKFAGISLFLLIAIIIWITASWHMWFYGGSYGQRAFIDFFALFAILLGYLLTSTHKWIRYVFILPVLCFIVFLNLTQTYQRYVNILPWDNVTQEIYSFVFLKTDAKYRDIFSPIAYTPDEWSLLHKVEFKNTMEDSCEHWHDWNTLTDEKAYSGKNASLIGNENMRSVSFIKKVKEVSADSNLMIRVNCRVNMANWQTDAVLVISFEDSVRSYSWNTFKLSQQVHENNTWCLVTARVAAPHIKSANDILNVYVQANEHEKIFVDDLEIKFLYYKPGAHD